MYTIGEVSKMFHLPISTLRYYDKEGLFPEMKRQSGIRQFTDREVEALRVIECLKQSGLEIREIRQFMQWCTEGPETYEKRKELFLKRKAAVEQEILAMERTLNLLKFKCWYYETAIAEGNEERIQKMLPNQLPKDVQVWYDCSHESTES